MLVCGCVNPPPITDPDYRGIYFTGADDLAAKAAALGGTPLLLEHGRAGVGSVLSAWTARDGSMFALAEIDVAQPAGAATAAAVRSGDLQGLSLGYTSKIRKCRKTGRLVVGDKVIRELSICKDNARPGCRILPQRHR